MARSVRPDILAAWARCLVRNGCAGDVADALALELEQVCLGQGVTIDRIRPADQPPTWDPEEARRAELARQPAPDLSGVRRALVDAQETVRRREVERREAQPFAEIQPPQPQEEQ